MEHAQIEKDLLNEDVARLEGEAVTVTSEPEQSQADIAQASKDQEELEQAFSMLLGAGFDTLCPAWNVKPAEVKQLAEVYAALIEKYFPGGVSRFGLEINAILLTTIIIVPRLKMPRKEKVESDDD